MTDWTAQGVGPLLRALDAGDVTSRELTRAFRARRRESLGAWIADNDAADAEAQRADDRRAAGETAPLLGVPLAVKDNILVAGLPATCGSRILDGFRPPRSATAVDRLRRAGALVLGKTNLDQFGMGSSTENSAFGPARNPWDPERVAGGSSGGSAVAVAAGEAPAALGSDTGGSLRQPAAFCGLVGFKPTYGRVSRLGLVAYGSSLDQIGTLTLDCADAARLLKELAGHDPRDATSAERPAEDWLGACAQGVAGMRVGLPEEYFGEGLDPRIERLVQEAAALLTRGGAQIERVSLPHTRYAVPAYYLIATAEASSNLSRYDGVRYGARVDGAGGLHEMYRATRGAGFGDEVKRRIMLGTFALSAGYYDAYYGKAQRVRARIRGDFEALFDAGLDLLLTPTTPAPAFRLGERVDDPLAMYLSDIYTVTANLAGLPAASVPVGLAGDLPVGAQLIGPPFAERALLAAGSLIEELWEGRRAPAPAEA